MRETERDSDDSTIEFGPKNVEPVLFANLNEIEQIRKEYPADKINDLALSIDLSSEDEPVFDLYNPLLCARLTPEEATDYLNEHAHFYGRDTASLDELTPNNDGSYTILISGHRRKRAIEQLIRQHHLDASQIKVYSNLREHISFEASLIAQIRENTYEKVSPEELARNIQQYYLYLERQDPLKRPTYRQIAASIGQSVDIVRDATKFMRLPEEIRDYSTHYRDLISYSTLVELEPLMRKAEEYADYKEYDGDKTTFVTEYLHGVVRDIINNKLDTQRKTVDPLLIIKGYIDTLSIETDFHQDSFFKEDEISSMRVTKSRMTKRLAHSAVLALKLAASDGYTLSPQEAETIQSIVSRFDEAKVSPTTEVEGAPTMDFIKLS